MINKLEDIGFYTLNNTRAENISAASPLWRCEMILTDRCNFSCEYCRGLRDDCQNDMPINLAKDCIEMWIKDGLKNVRFSGGEPLLYPYLDDLVSMCKNGGVEHIAISTNGSGDTEKYLKLIDCGVNDFSISLDSCCAAVGDKIAGVKGKWQKVVRNIRILSAKTYVTVGVVLTQSNLEETSQIIKFAYDLGVSDIRIIPAAQFDKVLTASLKIDAKILERCKILNYRIDNCLQSIPVRGLSDKDSKRCYLTMDDSVVAGQWHFPCVIYLREKGEPIGKVGPNMREERVKWSKKHNCLNNPICKNNCLDVCREFNNRVALTYKEKTP